jgi:hypothetical protein
MKRSTGLIVPALMPATGVSCIDGPRSFPDKQIGNGMDEGSSFRVVAATWFSPMSRRISSSWRGPFSCKSAGTSGGE